MRPRPLMNSYKSRFLSTSLLKVPSNTNEQSQVIIFDLKIQQFKPRLFKSDMNFHILNVKWQEPKRARYRQWRRRRRLHGSQAGKRIQEASDAPLGEHQHTHARLVQEMVQQAAEARSAAAEAYSARW